MDMQQAKDEAKALIEEMEDRLRNIKAIRGASYMILLRESYNTISIWATIIIASRRSPMERLVDVMGDSLQASNLAMIQNGLKLIAGNEEKFLELRNAFASDLEGMMKRVHNGSYVLLTGGDDSETERTSPGSQDSNTK